MLLYHIKIDRGEIHLRKTVRVVAVVLVLCIVGASGPVVAGASWEDILQEWVTPDLKLELQWQSFPQEGVEKQVLRRAVGGAGANGRDLAEFKGNNPGGWLDSTVDVGHYYIYQLQGCGEDDEVLVRSNIRKIRIGSNAPVDRPAIPQVDIGESGVTYLKLVWEEPDSDEEVKWYIIRRLGDEGLERMVKIVAPAVSFIDEGLLPEAEYEYQVFAFNNHGPSQMASVKGETLSIPPTGLKVEGRGFDWLQLTWDIPAKGLGLLLERVNAGGETRPIPAEAGVNSYRDGDLEPGQNYTYRGTFFYEQGYYGEDTVVDAATFDPPDAPAATCVEGRILLTWSPIYPEEVVDQRIYRSVGKEGPYIEVARLEPEEGAWADGDVNEGGSYSYQLCLRDKGGGEAWSGPVSRQVPPAAPHPEPGQGPDPNSGDDESPSMGPSSEEDRGELSARLTPIYQLTRADLESEEKEVLLALEELKEVVVKLKAELLQVLAQRGQELQISFQDLALVLHPSLLSFTGDWEIDLFLAGEENGVLPFTHPGRYQTGGKIYNVSIKSGDEVAVPLDLYFHYDLLEPAQEERLGIYGHDPLTDTYGYVGGNLDRNRRLIKVGAVPPGRYTLALCYRTFGDLDNHWARSPVEILASRHLWPPGDNFRPQDPLHRGEFTGWLMGILDLPTPSGLEKEGFFSDVNPAEDYGAEIAAARGLGLVVGRPNGVFAPREVITRQEMIHMVGLALLRYGNAGDKESTVLPAGGHNFTDYKQVQEWARSGIEAALGAGIIAGRDGGRMLGPSESATRAEGAAILARLLELMEVEP